MAGLLHVPRVRALEGSRGRRGRLLVVSLDRDEAELMSIIESSSCPGFLPLSETYTAASNFARHYGDGGLPWQTFVIDRDGIICFADYLAKLSASKLAA